MGKITSLRDLVGIVKDKASLSKAALLSDPKSASFHLAVLRATAHSPPAPPDDRRLSALLLLGESSRASAAPIVSAVMDRLRRTGSSVVAVKCLLVVHHIINRGPFILQDQLSIFPAGGGHNHLKLSAFRDGSTASAWALSAWVRWYALYLETLLSTSRVLGYLVCSSSSCSGLIRENQDRRISSFLNADLIGDVDSLVVLAEEVCRAPCDFNAAKGKTLVVEIMSLLSNDCLSLVGEILLRLAELNERLSCLGFGDSVELVCALRRLQECRERLSSVMCAVSSNNNNKLSVGMMWGLVEELKDKVGMSRVYKEGGVSLRTRERASESARFERRVFGNVDSVKFQSGRFPVQKQVAGSFL